jgi:hypothetical protein
MRRSTLFWGGILILIGVLLLLSLFFAPLAILSVSKSVFEGWSGAFRRVFGSERRLKP